MCGRRQVVLKYGIFTNPERDPNMAATSHLRDILQGLGCRIAYDEETAECLGVSDAEDAHDADILFVLGGDGTILNAAREYVPYGVPLVGVNLGHLGFMSELGMNQIEAFVQLAEAGLCNRDERMMLKATVSGCEPVIALNDFLLARREHKMARMNVWIGSAAEQNYDGDGLIVATPTGSTAYSLSAGGPIVDPRVQCILVTPLCPHSLGARSLVIPPEDRIKVQADQHDLVVSADGLESMQLTAGESIEFETSALVAVFLRMGRHNVVPTLASKLAQLQPGGQML